MCNHDPHSCHCHHTIYYVPIDWGGPIAHKPKRELTSEEIEKSKEIDQFFEELLYRFSLKLGLASLVMVGFIVLHWFADGVETLLQYHAWIEPHRTDDFAITNFLMFVNALVLAALGRYGEKKYTPMTLREWIAAHKVFSVCAAVILPGCLVCLIAIPGLITYYGS